MNNEKSSKTQFILLRIGSNHKEWYLCIRYKIHLENISLHTLVYSMASRNLHPIFGRTFGNSAHYLSICIVQNVNWPHTAEYEAVLKRCWNMRIWSTECCIRNTLRSSIHKLTSNNSRLLKMSEIVKAWAEYSQSERFDCKDCFCKNQSIISLISTPILNLANCGVIEHSL